MLISNLFVDLMAANQVLAMDAKSLLDVVDKARTCQEQQLVTDLGESSSSSPGGEQSTQTWKMKTDFYDVTFRGNSWRYFAFDRDRLLIDLFNLIATSCGCFLFYNKDENNIFFIWFGFNI